MTLFLSHVVTWEYTTCITHPLKNCTSKVHSNTNTHSTLQRRVTRGCSEIGGEKARERGCSRPPRGRTLEQCPSKCVRQLGRGVDWMCKPVEEGRVKRYFPNNKCPAEPPVEMTRQEILRRANVWISQRIAYSQFRNHAEPTISDGMRWRTDCAGFVTMAWDYWQSNCTLWVWEFSIVSLTKLTREYLSLHHLFSLEKSLEHQQLEYRWIHQKLYRQKRKVVQFGRMWWSQARWRSRQ